jgi:hypothetical protein
MHLVPSEHELFSAHLNPRKSQHCASVWHFASSAFCARRCSILNRLRWAGPSELTCCTDVLTTCGDARLCLCVVSHDMVPLMTINMP